MEAYQCRTAIRETQTSLNAHKDSGHLDHQIHSACHRVSESRTCCTYDHKISHSDATESESSRSSTYQSEHIMRLRVNTIEYSGRSTGVQKSTESLWRMVQIVVSTTCR